MSRQTLNSFTAEIPAVRVTNSTPFSSIRQRDLSSDWYASDFCSFSPLIRRTILRLRLIRGTPSSDKCVTGLKALFKCFLWSLLSSKKNNRAIWDCFHTVVLWFPSKSAWSFSELHTIPYSHKQGPVPRQHGNWDARVLKAVLLMLQPHWTSPVDALLLWLIWMNHGWVLWYIYIYVPTVLICPYVGTHATAIIWVTSPMRSTLGK